MRFISMGCGAVLLFTVLVLGSPLFLALLGLQEQSRWLLHRPWLLLVPGILLALGVLRAGVRRELLDRQRIRRRTAHLSNTGGPQR
ncbi:MAG: hypothetical protein HY335_08360 [Deinococcus sp.]|nr:hypothetical protein [Deinococcus sp.]